MMPHRLAWPPAVAVAALLLARNGLATPSQGAVSAESTAAFPLTPPTGDGSSMPVTREPQASVPAAPTYWRGAPPGAYGASQGAGDGAYAPVAVPPRAVTPRRQWYGWQTILVDLSAPALLIVGYGARGGAVAESAVILAPVTYVVGGPVVHLAHDRGGAAAGSLGLRVGLPFAGGLIGAAAERCSKPSSDIPCGFGGAVVGGLLGMLVASTFDAAVLANEEIVDDPRRASVSVAPTLDVKHGTAGLSMAGTF